MSLTLINGDGNSRVLASQDADWYGALTGQTTCIVPINDNLGATIADSNTIEISSGVCITKEGRRVQIDEGDIEEIIIPTGTQGVDTYYIIGFHLYINELGQQVAETFVETMASATDTITETTFKEGSSSIYVSLYRVKRSGLLIDSITRIIPILKTIVDINDILGSTDISAIGDGTVTGIIPTLNSDLTIKQNKIDNSLATTSKTVTGAINEVNVSLTDIASDLTYSQILATTVTTDGSVSYTLDKAISSDTKIIVKVLQSSRNYTLFTLGSLLASGTHSLVLNNGLFNISYIDSTHVHAWCNEEVGNVEVYANVQLNKYEFKIIRIR